MCKTLLLDDQKEHRGEACIPRFPFIMLHLPASAPFKVRCNKIATAGIINELEWARREGLISYLWDANQLATSLTVLLMIFSGPQAIPSSFLVPSTCLHPLLMSCKTAFLSLPTPHSDLHLVTWQNCSREGSGGVEMGGGAGL